MMFPGSYVLLEIMLRTVVVYLVVLAGVRLSGKREVSENRRFTSLAPAAPAGRRAGL
jgi:hypothetical protein